MRATVDYRRLLKKPERFVAPWLEGPYVWRADERVFRLTSAPPAPGWYELEASARDATVVGPAEAPDLGGLPGVSGHFVARGDGVASRDGVACDPRRFLALADGRAVAVHLLPEDEPPALASCRARRWPSGETLFESLALETEADDEVRRALEDGRPIAGLPAVPASLRAAYALSVLLATSGRLGIPAVPAELRRFLLDVATGGTRAAESSLASLAGERERSARERERRAVQLASVERAAIERERASQRVARAGERAPERLERTLREAGALFLAQRRLSGGQLEVVFRLAGERFVSIVEEQTLHVVDAGICLDGHDDLLSLASLPGVIREALETERLVVTRHSPEP